MLPFTVLLFVATVLVLLPVGTYAFGAGDIPDFAYLNDKAFRHGDIENILENLVKSAGGAAVTGGLLGFAKSVIDNVSGGPKFSKSDIKKVYFGNWLRDYSQAMDIAGLSKLSADTLVLVVSILGFMTFGFATEEFQVTADRLGVYLPVEHIDNPKGYAAKEGDARKFHPKLRPPVDDRELDIDERTGMKNYMASENEGWDTSTAFIRRTFTACIEHGRRSGGQDNRDRYEAYRLLGTGLHTLEDLLAHSNWCEVALRKLGHNEVFCHVGDHVTVSTPHGQAPPLVTGTFGGADFIFSLMGEATDKLSQASVTDLAQKMNQASQDGEDKFSALKTILGKLPIGGNNDTVNSGQQMHEQSKAYRFDPNNIAPPEVQRQLLDLLKWRDNIFRDFIKTVEMVPGLSNLLEELTNALNAFVYTVLSPYITPILQQATGILGEGSKAVIESDDQYEVFNNPNASDPTHSVLSKDHFDLILNEPAGKIAQIVVTHSVNHIVRAWCDDSNPNEVVERILEAFHHPFYATGHSEVQNQMFECLGQWLDRMSHQERQTVLGRLTKVSVRNGKNKRPESESGTYSESGYGGHSHGYQKQQSYGGGTQSQQTYGVGYESQQSLDGRYQGQQVYGHQQNYGSNHEPSSRRNDDSNKRGQGNDGGSRYGSSYGGDYSYSETQQSGNYGRTDPDLRRPDNSYGGNDGGNYDSNQRRNDVYRSRNEYGSRGDDDGSGYGGRASSGRRQEAGDAYSRRDDNYNSSHTDGRRSAYDGGNRDENYGSRRDDVGSYNDRGGHSGRRLEESRSYSGRDESYSSSYGSEDYSGRQSGYDGNQNSRNESGGYAPSYGQRQDRQEYDSSGHGHVGRRNEGSYSSSGIYERSSQLPDRDEYGSSGYENVGRRNEESYDSSGIYERSQRGYVGDDDTYGAERLNIRADNEDHSKHHGRHHRRRSGDDED